MTAATRERAGETEQVDNAWRADFNQHADGCPAADGARLERYEDVRPRDRRVMLITRCQECGGHRVTKTDRIQDPDTTPQED